MKKLVILVMCCFMFMGCTSTDSNTEDVQDSKIEIKEGTGTSEVIVIDDLIKKMDNKESFVVIVTQTYCNSCMAFFMEADAFLTESGVPLLELNLDNEKKEPDEVLDILHDKLHEFVMTPSIYYVRDGEVKDYLLSSNERVQLSNYKEFLIRNNIIKKD